MCCDFYEIDGMKWVIHEGDASTSFLFWTSFPFDARVNWSRKDTLVGNVTSGLEIRK